MSFGLNYAYNDTYWNKIDDKNVLGCGQFIGMNGTKQEIYDWVSKQFLLEALKNGGIPLDFRKIKGTEAKIEELRKLVSEGVDTLSKLGVDKDKLLKDLNIWANPHKKLSR